MKRIKFNTTWEEDEEEKRQFFASLSYSEQLKIFIKLRKLVNFHKESLKRFDLIICNHKLPAILIP